MAHRSPRALTRRLALALSLMMVVSVLALPAIAEDDTGRSYTADLEPSAVCDGVEEAFTLTLTNRSSQQRLGSARVDVPGEVELSTAVEVTVDVSRQQGRKTVPIVSYDPGARVISLDDLSAAPGADVTVFFTATATGATGTPLEFTTQAKQANDFNSTSETANELVLIGDQPSTTIVSCGTLKFVEQPGDTSINVAIPGKDGTGSPQVAIVDGAGEVIKSASASITISLAEDHADGAKLHGDPTRKTDDGVATFAGLSIDKAGAYTLTASADGYLGVVSESFEVFPFGDTCAIGDVCETPLNDDRDGSTSLSGTASGGTGSLLGSSESKDDKVEACGAVDDYGNPVDYDLGDYSYLPNQVTIGGTNLIDKLIEFRVSKQYDQRQANNGVSFYQVCATRLAPFNQSSIFVDIFGNTVANPEDTVNLKRLGLDPDEVGITFQTSGFLPDCTSADDSPCVVSRVKRGGDPVITVRWGSRWRMR